MKIIGFIYKYLFVMFLLISIGLEEKVCIILGIVGFGEGIGYVDLNSCFLDFWVDIEN